MTAAVSEAIDAELSDRGASAFVYVGPARDPAIRYVLRAIEEFELHSPQSVGAGDAAAIHAVAHDGDSWYHRTAGPDAPSPGAPLSTELVDAGLEGLLLAPARLPHDAALYLEEAGFSLASSDVLARTRAGKSAAEREAIERTQLAATAGLEAVAAVLDGCNVADERRLVFEGDPITPERLRIVADGAIVDAGALPAENTTVTSRGPVAASRDPADALSAGEPIVLALAPRGLAGYHGGLVRTLIVAGEGGDERRAHVALTLAFRSAAALLSTDGSVSVADVEHDLEAEIRAFGFEDGIETDVAGVGIEPRERPVRDDATIDSDAVVRIETAVESGGGRVRLADLYAPGEGWLVAPSRSLDPAALLE